MALLNVTRFNNEFPGLKTFQDSSGDIKTTYSPNDGEPLFEVNYSNMARKVLEIFGLKEDTVEKYGADREGEMKADLKKVQADIRTCESNDTAMTKEASARLEELRKREGDLVDSLRDLESTDG